MATFTAIFDACVLYPAPTRDLLMRLALTGLFRARWTDRIHDEWTAHLLADRPDLKREQIARTRELMDRNVVGCLVTGYEVLIESLHLPDPKDRHVLAAAIRSGAGVIVTNNLKDFPNATLRAFGIEAQDPDEFVLHLIDLDEDAVVRAVRAQRAGLKEPVVTAEQLLRTLERQGLAETVARLRVHAARL